MNGFVPSSYLKAYRKKLQEQLKNEKGEIKKDELRKSIRFIKFIERARRWGVIKS